MSGLAYFDGAFDEAPRVSLFDRAVLLGDGVFETLRVSNGRAVRLEAHLDRLLLGAAMTGLAPREDRARITEIARELAARSSAEAALRIQLGRGEGPRGLGPEGFGPARLSAFVRPFEAWPRSLAVEWCSAPRVPAACLDPRFKTTSAMPALLARRSIGAREGLQRALDGQLVSGLSSNVFLLFGERLVTPHLASGCLPGVTRAAALSLAPSLGLGVEERRVEPEELSSADEVLLSSALMGVVSVAAIDGRARREGRWARALDEALR